MDAVLQQHCNPQASELLTTTLKLVNLYIQKNPLSHFGCRSLAHSPAAVSSCLMIISQTSRQLFFGWQISGETFIVNKNHREQSDKKLICFEWIKTDKTEAGWSNVRKYYN